MDNKNAPPYLSVAINIGGSNHCGKTLLAAKLTAFFKKEGIMDVTFNDNESPPSHFAAMVREGKDVDYDFPANTKVIIQEQHGLTREQRMDALKLKYLGTGEHHEFTRRMWADEHLADSTMCISYWSWLIDKIDNKVS